jgi:hypothetical protein
MVFDLGFLLVAIAAGYLFLAITTSLAGCIVLMKAGSWFIRRMRTWTHGGRETLERPQTAK